MTKTDYIITGVGAAGLILAYRMACDAYFDNKSIIIIDKNKTQLIYGYIIATILLFLILVLI